jgi:hypothetical protein
MTFGISHYARRSPELEEFYPHIAKVIKAARAAPGFGSKQPELGELIHPSFYDDRRRTAGLEVSQSLFIWDNVEAAIAFTYSGVHDETLRRNRDVGWFSHAEWPSYVAWWEASDQLTWSIGCSKLEQLHHSGPTPSAFNFKMIFGADGNRYRLDRELFDQYRAKYTW